MLTLTNGHKVADITVATTLMSADAVAADPIAFFEMVELAKNPAHRLFGNTGALLERVGIIQAGIMLDDVRAVIDAAFEIQGNAIVKRNPVTS